MKLLIVARPFVFHGGVERATAGLIRALVEHGYEVHLASPPGQKPVDGVVLHRLPVPPLTATARALTLALATRLIAARGWDVVQSHERTLGQDIYRAGEGCHRGYLLTRGRAPGRRLYHRVVLALEGRVFARTPRIVAISCAGKREIETLYGVSPDRVTVIYNGVDLERFHPNNRRTLRAAARREAALDAEAWTALFVGSGFERKGLATAIEALALLDDRQSRLIVVGKGDTRPYEALASRHDVTGQVIWLGPRADIERWYAAADVAVLPSRYEPFGNVHLEALASGLPVVASVTAGGSELIRPGLNGAVVDARDPGAIAAALAELRQRAIAGGAETCAAARASAEPYTYVAQVAAFGRLYAECAAGKAKLY
ncbi:MAG TPA: glycosyltransferase family 4 protein [Methylomirabilota bacterium]|nr:glycosyltransferase family 4 protein [Methylomirabilota bacterium]